uniref:Basement membrane-specific heparan sulfate proteoglycan core protein n=1 Tax=Magallana gigas TaxID=29159 RepID=K1R4A6_MAGGI
MYTRVQKRGRTTEVVIPAEQRLDGLSCYCTAQASGFQASSKPALVSVRYIPTDYPQISRTATSVSVGSPVVLRCSLSSAGNPPVTWSWFCNDVMVNKGVNQMGKSTELSFLAEQNDDKKGCYCRAKNSLSVTGRYDEKSSDSYIRIIGTPIVSSVRQSEKGGISPVAFGVTLAFLLVVIVTCLVVIVIQHKRIPKESSLTSWFLVKIGRRSNLESQIQDTKCTIEEHSYEVLTTGNQSKAYQLPTPYLTLNDNNVTEGQPIALRCSIYSPEPQPVTWYWRCGDSNMTGNASVGLHDTVLTFPSDRKYNGVVCYCKVRPSAANDSYSKMSNHLTINVRSYQLPTPYLTLNDNNVTEGQPIALRCSIYSPEPQPVTWYWRCGDSNMTGNASVGLHDTVLTFPSDRKYNGVVCYCKVRPSAANDSYSKMSNHLTINVRYTPRSIPFLNASNTAVVAGEEITLQCTLDTLGNPQVTWTWKCGRYAVYNQRTVNVNATSKLILKGEPDLNNKVCHCVARNYFLHYEAASNAVSLSVYCT